MHISVAQPGIHNANLENQFFKIKLVTKEAKVVDCKNSPLK